MIEIDEFSAPFSILPFVKLSQRGHAPTNTMPRFQHMYSKPCLVQSLRSCEPSKSGTDDNHIRRLHETTRPWRDERYSLMSGSFCTATHSWHDIAKAGKQDVVVVIMDEQERQHHRVIALL